MVNGRGQFGEINFSFQSCLFPCALLLLAGSEGLKELLFCQHMICGALLFLVQTLVLASYLLACLPARILQVVACLDSKIFPAVPYCEVTTERSLKPNHSNRLMVVLYCYL